MTVVVDVQAVMAAAARVMDVPLAAMTSKCRSKCWVEARQIAIWVAVRLTGQTFVAIGQAFGRDHSTVAHALDRMDERIAGEPRLAAAAKAIIANITATPVRPGEDAADGQVATKIASLERVGTVRRLGATAPIRPDHGQIAARVQALRRLGWTIAGLARQFQIPEQDIGRMLGERWPAESASA